MKLIKSAFLVFSILIIAVAFSACGGDSDTSDKTGKEYTSAYICPMHCEGSGSDTAGKCPVCKMDYVANEDYKAEDENTDADKNGKHEDGDHDGHDHGDHDGHNH